MTLQDDASGTSSVPDTTSSPDTSVSQDSTATSSPDTSGSNQAAPNPGDNSASPPDALADDKAALLAVVKKVVEVAPKNPAGEGQAAAPDSGSTTETKPDPQVTAPALEEDPTADELKALAPKTKARIEKLLDQRKAARQEAEALKAPASKWAQMDGYLKKHDLAAEDANTLLGVGAALRAGDFKKFLDGVMPYVELAQQALGQTLPQALRAKVEAGEMTEDAAKQLSVTSIQNNRLQNQVKAQTDAQAAQRAAEQNATVMNAASSAVTQWETGIRSRDPDYALKASEVEAEARLLIAAHGPIKNSAEAVAIAERAYARVNRLFAAGRPAVTATPKQPSGARAVNTATAAPQSMMEAAKAALDRMRAA